MSRTRAHGGPDTTGTLAAADLPPNHHGDGRWLDGVMGYLAGLTMLVGRRRHARLVARLAGLDGNDHVVDIGCGPGTAARIAARHGARVTGVDPSAPMLRLARLTSIRRQGTASLQWLRAGAEDLPLPDESSTVCWSLAAVHHWSDLDAAVDEVARVLAPGGRFIVLEHRIRVRASGRAGHGWTPAQAARFAAILTSAGFEDVRVANHDVGRRGVVTVVATAPGPPG